MHVTRFAACECRSHEFAFRLSRFYVVETALYNGQLFAIGVVVLSERLGSGIDPQNARLHACFLIIDHSVCQGLANNLARLFWGLRQSLFLGRAGRTRYYLLTDIPNWRGANPFILVAGIFRLIETM